MAQSSRTMLRRATSTGWARFGGSHKHQIECLTSVGAPATQQPAPGFALQRHFPTAHKRPRDAQLSDLALLGAAALIAAAAAVGNGSEAHCKEESKLPTYTRSDVAKHKTKADGGIWVYYQDGVYDITNFAASHPGGASKILMAAGGSLEPFWKIYRIHKENEEVHKLLAGLRIGNLSKEDQAAAKVDDSKDPFAKDPERHPSFKINAHKPFNAEPPGELLMDAGFLTPGDLFYVRNHLPVPHIDPKDYRLKVAIEGVKGSGKLLELTLDDLRTKFPQVKVAAAIQCAGNRRSEMTAIKPVKGLNWTSTAISNAEWTGVRLRDVLKHAGLDVDAVAANDGHAVQHIQFEGLDTDNTTTYGASIPAIKALDPRGDVLLAFQMNGEDLPLDHGYPVRLVAPGIVGARNVKWLGKIVASPKESESHWQQKDYKGFNPGVDWDTVDFSKAPAIQDMPVTSVICSPENGSAVSRYDDELTVRGYAWSGGGRGIVRVDVSVDGGATWLEAKLKPTGQKLYRSWAWTLWEISVPVPKDQGELKVLCKAVDAAYNVQPDSVEPIWNLRGVLVNNWHQVKYRVAEDVE